MNKLSTPSICRRALYGGLVCVSIFSATLFQSCSKDDGGGEDPGTGQSVVIGTNLNMPTGGTISIPFTDSPAGSGIDKVVDGDKATDLVMPRSAFSMTWNGTKSVQVICYSLTSGNEDSSTDPKSWKLSGSRDGKNWIQVDVQAGQSFTGRGETKEYKVSNNTRYRYYKLDIQANNGGASTRIAEWAMAEPEADMDISDLIAAYAYGQSDSPATPMGKKYAGWRKTTAEDKVWLMDVTNEPGMQDGMTGFQIIPFENIVLFPFGTPRPADCNQHAIGDCGLVAALAALAYQNPAFVKTLVKDNGDKTYTVNMYDPQGLPVQVKVSNKFIAGSDRVLSALSGKSRTATWGTVLEKAVMKYNLCYTGSPNVGGIGQEHVTPLFTGNGNSYAIKAGVLTAAEMTRMATVSLRQGKFVFGGFKKGDVPIPGGGKTVTAHVYTFSHTANDVALFSMRNPWGGNQTPGDRDDGVLNIPNVYDIISLIDLRIVEPGASGDKGQTDPYIPPFSNEWVGPK